MADDPPPILCYEITHAGEGPPGRSVEILGEPYRHRPDLGAMAASEYFDDLDIDAERLTDSDLDGSQRVIEVRGCGPEPVRYRVRTRVERRYEASRVGAEENRDG